MKIKDLVPSFETCKRLNELGRGEKTEFYWSEQEFVRKTETVVKNILTSSMADNYHSLSFSFPAPTAEELIKELPENIKYQLLEISKVEGCYSVKYYDREGGESDLNYIANISLAEAAAQMWMRLKENKYI